jgi:hypothetical protein
MGRHDDERHDDPRQVPEVHVAAGVGVFLATSGYAQQSQPAPPAAKPAKAPKKAPAPVVEPVLEKALELLKAASDRLAAARTMRFTAVISYESPSLLGPPPSSTTTARRCWPSYRPRTWWPWPTPHSRLTQSTRGEDAKDAEHVISPEERLRVAMVIQ